MSHRHIFAMIVVFCTLSQVGCVCMSNRGCGGCGMTGASCGLADASCGCPSCGVADASCGCADVSCGCPSGCGSGVGGCSPALAKCPLLVRMRNAICGCSSGCGGAPYCSEWSDCPPCESDPCDCYGNYNGGPYGSQHGRRARMAKRNINFGDELRASDEGETIYR